MFLQGTRSQIWRTQAALSFMLICGTPLQVANHRWSHVQLSKLLPPLLVSLSLC